MEEENVTMQEKTRDGNVRRNQPVLLAFKREEGGHESRKGLLIYSTVT